MQTNKNSRILMGASIGFVAGLILLSPLLIKPLAFLWFISAVLGPYFISLALSLVTFGSVNWMDSSVPVILTPILYMCIGALIAWLLKKKSRAGTYLKAALIVFVVVLILFGFYAYKTVSPAAFGQNMNGSYDCSSIQNQQNLGLCYIKEALITGSPDHCLTGLKEGLVGMPYCILNAAAKSKDTSICKYFIDGTFASLDPINYGKSAQEGDYGRCIYSITGDLNVVAKLRAGTN